MLCPPSPVPPSPSRAISQAPHESSRGQVSALSSWEKGGQAERDQSRNLPPRAFVCFKGGFRGSRAPGPSPPSPAKGTLPPPCCLSPVPLVGGSGPGGGTVGCCTSLRASSHPKSVPVASLEDAQGSDAIPGFSQAATMQCPSPGDSICPGEQMGPSRPCPSGARPPEAPA